MIIITMNFILNDGGRKEAGYLGEANDCVVRAIAIATQTPYQQVYEELNTHNHIYSIEHNDRVSKKISDKGTTPRNGNYRRVYDLYLETKGWIFTPTMSIGSGCKVHLKESELPKGRIIARVSRHLVAVIDGVINDTHDPSRGGTRCVYGYYSKV